MYYFKIDFCKMWCECARPIFYIKNYQSRCNLVAKLSYIKINIDICDIKCE